MSLLTLYFGSSAARMAVLAFITVTQPSSSQHRHEDPFQGLTSILLPHHEAAPHRQALLTVLDESQDRSRVMMAAWPSRPFLSDLLPLGRSRRKLPSPRRSASLLSVAQTHRFPESDVVLPSRAAKPQLLPL